MMYIHQKIPALAACIALAFWGAKQEAAAQTASPFMMIAAGDPALDCLRLVALEAGLNILSFTPPLSRDEVENILNSVDTASLSAPAREAYNIARARLNPRPRFAEEGFSLTANALLQFEAGFRSNSGIPWRGNGAMRPAALSVPLGAYFFNTAEIFVAPEARLDPDFNETGGNFFINVPVEAGQMDMFFPFRAYAAFGGSHWNFQIGRDNLDFGAARRGNLLISNAPDYYEFGRFSLFSRHFKYSSLITHIPLLIEEDLYDTSTLPSGALTKSLERYLYLHRIDVNILDKLSLTLTEGLTVGESPLSLRYLNPIMIMHNWTSGDEYPDWAGGDELNSSIFLVEVNWTPARHLRLYGQLVLDELTTPWEVESDTGHETPQGAGYLAGIEVNRALGLWGGLFFFEAAYTDPYVYADNSPFAGYYWARRVNHFAKHQRYRWLGHPEGRDMMLFTLGAEFSRYGAQYGYRYGARQGTGADAGEPAGGGASAAGAAAHGEHSEPQTGLTLAADLSCVIHGEHGIYWDWKRGKSYATERTPTGTPERVFTAALAAQWRPLPALAIKLSLAGMFAQNSGNVEEDDLPGIEAVLKISYLF